ncbi:J domain-containing protein [Halovivax cerinus]|uniref:J domain-containing protein n=1 Tax=Halovivax cerinus TaxID=1487865 RepID=A0ABD5NNI4_9EURY|nr:J domain-containing protein [Halovivax cerinus]
MGVADETQRGCDGCDRSVAVADLTTVSMPDGTLVACCPRCTPHARAAAKRAAELDTTKGTCDGCRTTVAESDLEDVVLTDGAVVSLCGSCREDRPGRSRTPSSGVADTETTEIARRKSLCTHCHEWVDEERYRVTLVDDRAEKLCETCKETAVETGIVVDVSMRRTDARDILGVDEGASTAAIRSAFQTQIKNAHPDRPTGTREAFRLVTEAYDRLRSSQ